MVYNYSKRLRKATIVLCYNCKRLDLTVQLCAMLFAYFNISSFQISSPKAKKDILKEKDCYKYQNLFIYVCQIKSHFSHHIIL